MSSSVAKHYYKVEGSWPWGKLSTTLWAEDRTQAIEIGRILLERTRRPGALDAVKLEAKEVPA